MELKQKKESMDYQLQLAMSTLEERQEEVLRLNESKETLQKKLDEDISKIVALRSSLSEGTFNMETLEHQIYELSIQNLNLREYKERLIELISEMVKSSQQGEPTAAMLAILKSIPEDKTRQRLETILIPKPGSVN